MRHALVLILLMVGTALPCSYKIDKAVYSKHTGSTSALFRFEEDGKAGFINAQGRVVIPPRFVPDWFAGEDFFEGLSPVQAGRWSWGVINERGEWVVTARYSEVDRFSEGLASVVDNSANLRAYIDKTGKIAIRLPGAVFAGRFSEGLAKITLHSATSVGKTGYMDKTGRMVIQHQFGYGGDFHSGLARVILDGKCYMLVDDSIASTPPSVQAVTSCGGIPPGITRRCREGFIDKTGKLLFEFQATRDFSEGLAAVSVRGKWGYIRPDGNLAIGPNFDEALPFTEGLAAVRNGTVWGYIDPRGRFVIPPRFSEARSFSDGLARVKDGYIDKTGRQVLSGRSGSDFVQGLAHVKIGTDHYGYMDKTGKTVFEYRELGPFATNSVSGVIRDSSGKPAPGVRVFLLKQGRTDEYDDEGVTNGLGQFRFVHIDQGPHYLAVSPFGATGASPYEPVFYGGAATRERAQMLEIEPTTDLRGADIQLGNRIPTRKIRIRTMWPDGKPVLDTLVLCGDARIKSKDTRYFDSAAPDSTGVNACSVLTDRPYRIRVFRVQYMDTKDTPEVIIPAGARPEEVAITIGAIDTKASR